MPTNKKLARCEHCGLVLAPSEGFVFRCMLERCADEAHVAAGGGWHIVCNSQMPCHARAKKAASTARPKLSKEELKAEVHAAMLRLEAPSPDLIVKALERNRGISRALRRRGSVLLKKCSVKCQDGICQFVGPASVVAELSAEPLAWALRSLMAELTIDFVAEADA